MTGLPVYPFPHWKMGEPFLLVLSLSPDLLPCDRVAVDVVEDAVGAGEGGEGVGAVQQEGGVGLGTVAHKVNGITVG